jgi:hypothetical protein
VRCVFREGIVGDGVIVIAVPHWDGYAGQHWDRLPEEPKAAGKAVLVGVNSGTLLPRITLSWPAQRGNGSCMYREDMFQRKS